MDFAFRKREGRYLQKGQNRISLCIQLALLLLQDGEAPSTWCCPSPVDMQEAVGQVDRTAERETTLNIFRGEFTSNIEFQTSNSM